MIRYYCILIAIALAPGCSSSSGGEPLDLGTPDLQADDFSVADASPDLAPEPCASSDGIPPTLECAGLYSDFAAKTIATDVLPYTPAYQLWSDGAKKSRWVSIPAGQQIDVTSLQDWVFPVGTRFYKEFRVEVGGVEKRIETRMYWKRHTASWVGVVYRWSDDETSTTRLTGGEAQVDGTTYEVPAENRCVACHKGKTDAPLGFETVLLAAPAAAGLTFAELQSQALLTATNGNATVAPSALQIPGNATEQAAIGYLHANCGMACHKGGGGSPFSLYVDVSSGMAPAQVEDTTAFAAINAAVVTGLQPPPDMMSTYYRIRPTDTSRSMVHVRMDIRDAAPAMSGVNQMPPLITHTVDSDGLAAVDAWIDSMTQAPYPAPSP